jgi:hypothetical protein
LTLLSPTELDATKGDVLTFSVDRPGTVYLIPSNTSGSQTDFENVIVSGKGLKYIVEEADVNKELTFDNVELRTVGGPMGLMAWGGEWVSIDLNESAIVEYENVTMENHFDDSLDSIKVGGLQEGDIIRLYSVQNYNSPVAEATVAPGEDFVIFGHYDAINPNVTFLITRQSVGRFESKRYYGFRFPEANEPPQSIVSNTVTIPAEGINVNINNLVSDPDGDTLTVWNFSSSNPNVVAIVDFDGSVIKLERGSESGSSEISFIVNDMHGHETTVSFTVSWSEEVPVEN